MAAITDPVFFIQQESNFNTLCILVVDLCSETLESLTLVIFTFGGTAL